MPVATTRNLYMAKRMNYVKPKSNVQRLEAKALSIQVEKKQLELDYKRETIQRERTERKQKKAEKERKKKVKKYQSQYKDLGKNVASARTAVKSFSKPTFFSSQLDSFRPR